jgi:hypothetical protein
MQRDVFAAPNTHPELETFEPIEPPHTLPIHAPAFPA